LAGSRTPPQPMGRRGCWWVGTGGVFSPKENEGGREGRNHLRGGGGRGGEREGAIRAGRGGEARRSEAADGPRGARGGLSVQRCVLLLPAAARLPPARPLSRRPCGLCRPAWGARPVVTLKPARGLCSRTKRCPVGHEAVSFTASARTPGLTCPGSVTEAHRALISRLVNLRRLTRGDEQYLGRVLGQRRAPGEGPHPGTLRGEGGMGAVRARGQTGPGR